MAVVLSLPQLVCYHWCYTAISRLYSKKKKRWLMCTCTPWMAEGENIPPNKGFAWMMGLTHVRGQLLHRSGFCTSVISFQFLISLSLNICLQIFFSLRWMQMELPVVVSSKLLQFLFLGGGYLSCCQTYFLTVCTLIEKLSLSKMPFRGDPIIGMSYFK